MKSVNEIIKEYRKGCSCGDECFECADAAINAIEKRMNQHITTKGTWSCTESELMEIIAEHDKKVEQPKQYKCEKITESNFDVWDLRELLDNGELFSKRSDGGYIQYSSNAPLYMLGDFSEYGVYHRIELTQEELEAQKVASLAGYLHENMNLADALLIRASDLEKLAAELAIEWMKQEG